MAPTAASVTLSLDEDQQSAVSSHANPHSLQVLEQEMSQIVSRKPKIVFVLGGPGSGKGTQCQLIVKHFRFVHLSVGDLLRAEAESGSALGNDIQRDLKEGKLVSSDVVVDLILSAMNKSSINHFLIDGFPRIYDNLTAFQHKVGITPEFVLFFSSPDEELQRRLLQRGRGDDNVQTIRKRLQVFHQETLPVVEYYENRALLRRVNAARSIEDIFQTVKIIFSPFIQDELLELTEELLKAIDTGDYAVYKRLCDAELTAFEPESQGHLVEELSFHRFYFNIPQDDHKTSSVSRIVAPKIKILTEDVGLVTYTRLIQHSNRKPADAFNETRVWKRNRLNDGEWEWRNIHFHRSKAPTVQNQHGC